jgi:thiol-disulfide isomerase/thioredoxin
LKAGTILQLLFISVAAAAVYLFVGAAQSDQRRMSCSAMCAFNPDYAARNRTAPDFELPDMQGKKVRLSSFRGKTVFLNFWTKTCGPCLKEMPLLGDFARTIKDRKDMVILTVSTDDGPNDVRDTLKVALSNEMGRPSGRAEDIPFVVLFDPESKVVNGLYGTRMFPETWVIDPGGVIRARFDGERNWGSAGIVEIGEMVAKPGGCLVEFSRGKAQGQFAGLCDSDG